MKLKKMLKKSKTITRIGYLLRQYNCHSAMKRYISKPIEKDKVLLGTTEGRFNDTPRAIAEYLHEHYPKIRIVWAYRKEEYRADFPDYIIPVRYESDEYYKEMATSIVWVFGTLIPAGTIKKNGQVYIQAWHGDKPFKKIANDAASDNKAYRRRTAGRRFVENELCDYVLTGCDFFIPIWQRAADYHGTFIRAGLPRNDCLVRHSDPEFYDRKQCTKKKYSLNDERVLIYAPTFRDHQINNGSIGTDIDLRIILDKLEEKYECQWKCLMRAHGGKKLYLDNCNQSDDRIIDVTTYPDIGDLLLISDMLITDYSSCAGDFALTGRPVLLYQDDFEQYTSQDRSLYFKMEDTPFRVAHNMRELIELIEAVDEKTTEENDREILQLYQATESGRATEAVCKVIAEATIS